MSNACMKRNKIAARFDFFLCIKHQAPCVLFAIENFSASKSRIDDTGNSLDLA